MTMDNSWLYKALWLINQMSQKHNFGEQKHFFALLFILESSSIMSIYIYMSKSIQAHNNWALLVKLNHRCQKLVENKFHQSEHVMKNICIFFSALSFIFVQLNNSCPTDSYLLCVKVKILVITHLAITYFCTPDILAIDTNIICFMTPLLWQADPLSQQCCVHQCTAILYLLATFVCHFFKIANEI